MRPTGLVALGGVHTVRSLVAANLVDGNWLKFNPAIVGRGGSMFSDVVERRALTLRSARSFPSGPSRCDLLDVMPVGRSVLETSDQTAATDGS